MRTALPKLQTRGFYGRLCARHVHPFCGRLKASNRFFEILNYFTDGLSLCAQLCDPMVTVKFGVFCLSLQLHFESLSRENITLNNLAGNEVSTRRGSPNFAVALGRGL